MNERPNPTNVESLRDRLTREQVEHTARERSKHHAQALRDTTRDYDEQSRVREQDERAADALSEYRAQTDPMPVTYRLYTEDKTGLGVLVTRYFPAATLYDAIGIWHNGTEMARVIEIVGTRADLQRVCDLAGDIKVANHQTSVLVTWAPCSRLDV